MSKRYYFKALGGSLRLPDAIIETEDYSTRVDGVEMEASFLNPPDNFCAVLAASLKILDHESVQYSKNDNLIVMKLQGELANLEDFTLPYAKKEGLKEKNLSFPSSTIIYYAIVPNSLDRVSFSYFDTKNNEFRTLFVPIVVKDESVSTQSDIRPSEDKNKKVKILLFALAGGVLILLFILKRSIAALIFGIGFLLYAGYLMIPMKKVCVKPGSRIYILPTRQSTVFEKNARRKIYEELNRVNGYVKIKLSDKKVGWVKDEDTCKD